MKHSSEAVFIPWRFYFLIFIILLIVAGLFLRIGYLALIEQHFLQKQGDERVLRTITGPAFRGMITDRNNYPLAVSTSVYSVWINPKEFSMNSQDIKKLSKILTISSIRNLIQHNKNKKHQFIYLKRGVSPEIADTVKSWLIPGVYLQQEYKRYYPEGEITAHLIGFTNVDDKGQEGLELAYDSWLSGISGKKRVVKDRRGRIISDVQILQEQKPGHDLKLSINRRIQYLAYRELLTGVKTNQAESGSAVVLDVKTGEILAMVNQPSYNPNNRLVYTHDRLRNRAVTDVFEPGSTIKAFSIATALDSGQYHPNTVIDTSPGWMHVGHRLVRDEHNNGPLTVREILEISSNVGATKIMLSLPSTRLRELLHRVGFGEVTGIGFPGERAGALPFHTQWAPFTLATLTFGYGLSVTTLQLAQAYSVLANEGIKIPLTLLQIDSPPKGEQVMDPKVAKEMVELLESVVSAKKGTAKAAHILGYRVSGKTGTAVIAGLHGYQKHHYIASFVGIAPASRPRLVVAVVIRDPKGKEYHGGSVSAPVFAKVMEGALRILNVPPDNGLI